MTTTTAAMTEQIQATTDTETDILSKLRSQGLLLPYAIAELEEDIREFTRQMSEAYAAYRAMLPQEPPSISQMAASPPEQKAAWRAAWERCRERAAIRNEAINAVYQLANAEDPTSLVADEDMATLALEYYSRLQEASEEVTAQE